MRCRLLACDRVPVPRLEDRWDPRRVRRCILYRTCIVLLHVNLALDWKRLEGDWVRLLVGRGRGTRSALDREREGVLLRGVEFEGACS